MNISPEELLLSRLQDVLQGESGMDKVAEEVTDAIEEVTDEATETASEVQESILDLAISDIIKTAAFQKGFQEVCDAREHEVINFLLS